MIETVIGDSDALAAYVEASAKAAASAAAEGDLRRAQAVLGRALAALAAPPGRRPLRLVGSDPLRDPTGGSVA